MQRMTQVFTNLVLLKWVAQHYHIINIKIVLQFFVYEGYALYRDIPTKESDLNECIFKSQNGSVGKRLYFSTIKFNFPHRLHPPDTNKVLYRQ